MLTAQGCYGLKSFSTFAPTAASILISVGHFQTTRMVSVERRSRHAGRVRSPPLEVHDLGEIHFEDRQKQFHARAAAPSSPQFFSSICFALARRCWQNFSPAGVTSPLLARTMPTSIGAGAGEMGCSFNRFPTMRLKISGTTATPRPHSISVIRLLAPSHSTATAGIVLLCAKTRSSSW